MNIRVGISNFFQFIIGFIIGILILAGGSAFLGYYFFSKMSATPDKPIFTEELPPEETQAKSETTASKDASASNNNSSNQAAGTKPFLEGQESDSEQLEAGAYKARVTWPRGLILRDTPSTESTRIGGVAHNREIVILEESQDGRWQKIRIPGSNQTGWIKAGNIQRVN